MSKNTKIDILTKVNIAKDYEAIFKEKITSYIVKLTIFVIYYAFVLWLISLFPLVILLDLLLMLPFMITAVYIIRFYVKEIVQLFKNRKRIINGDYIVVNEKVVNSLRKERRNKFLVFGVFVNPVLAFYFLEPIPYRLVFSGFGEYKILSAKYYISSTMYEMNEEGIFNRAATGDEHILVVCDKEIALAYNTKMFEYKEN